MIRELDLHDSQVQTAKKNNQGPIQQGLCRVLQGYNAQHHIHPEGPNLRFIGQSATKIGPCGCAYRSCALLTTVTTTFIQKLLAIALYALMTQRPGLAIGSRLPQVAGAFMSLGLLK